MLTYNSANRLDNIRKFEFNELGRKKTEYVYDSKGNSNDARCMNIPLRPLEIDRSLLDRFDPITLERMDAIRLMNRIDTKYVTDILLLREILEDAQRQGYLVFELDGNGSKPTTASTSTLPTSGCSESIAEENSSGRKYAPVSTSVPVSAFLRSRKKNNHSRTRKKRVGVPPDDFHDFREDPEACLLAGLPLVLSKR